MEVFFTLDNLVTLTLLMLLQAVLGVDNSLYISQASKRVTFHQQQKLRRYALISAILLRILFLVVLVKMIAAFQSALFSIVWFDIISAQFTLHSLLFLLGGIMIMYTATKEISHMLMLEQEERKKRQPRSFVHSSEARIH